MPSTSHMKNWSELIQAKTGRVVFLYIDSESSVFTKKLFILFGRYPNEDSTRLDLIFLGAEC